MRTPGLPTTARPATPLLRLAVVALLAQACASARAPTAGHDFFCTLPDRPLVVAAGAGLLARAAGRTIVRHTAPAHGTLAVGPDGSFTYTPARGFVGEDSFTIAATDAIELHRVRPTTLATVGGVAIDGEAYGSAWTPVPGLVGEFYGLTDRGPNVDGPAGDSKMFPLPAYAPAIGRFTLERGVARRTTTLALRDTAGAPLTGVPPGPGSGGTGEIAFDRDGRPLPPDPRGLDPEGLVALADGTFWVADEYGPSLTHFAADGTTLEKITPFADARGHRLPRVLARRAPNRGLEGLTITPDGATLVAILQSALANDIDAGEAKQTAPVRIVSFDRATGATRQYIYLLDDPATSGTVVSEIAAVSATEFLVLERDGEPVGAPSSIKRLYRVSLAGATDVGVARKPGDFVDEVRGLLVGGTTTIEALARARPTAEARAALAAAAIVPVTKTLALDVSALLRDLDPAGELYAHDKLEGLALQGGGRRVVLSNDSDFGIDATDPPSHAVAAKTISTTGAIDTTEVLVVDLARLPARTVTSTVAITVATTCPSRR